MTDRTALLDLADGTLHRCGPVHLNTACGIGPLRDCLVGPREAVAGRARRLCPECWPRGSVGP